ncbi:hypothetical protein [Luteimonas sp. FCS-9]|uniref:hypothetical protein n=1 Tax=Luteimonas sp. FCS-9 TaxID=1547516 RepID=UPI00063EA57D|nr:hypothetical protein [Luteimonas sp. FCS-9]KLJ00725.1 hypothetical protein WQ56_07975 [Luteimonas sp. FCS-9]
MTAGEEALDIAFGLLRVPARREALRTRPLPDGVTEVIEIASGDDDALRAAVARTGHAPAELLEATRFYVQQVLLADGADAYRVLGARPGAEHARLRRHHRLLLRWLHPDRGQDWGDAFAWRINDAWRALRTPAARARYEAQRPAAAMAPPAGARPPAATAAGPARPPLPVPGPDRRSVAAPWIVGLLAATCLLLAWLAMRADWTPPHEDDPVVAVRPPRAASPSPSPGSLPRPTSAPPVPASSRRPPAPDNASSPAPAAAMPADAADASLVEDPPPAAVADAVAPRATPAALSAPEAPPRRPAPVPPPAAPPVPPSASAGPMPAPSPGLQAEAEEDPSRLMREAERMVAALVDQLTARSPAAPVPEPVADARDALHARVAPALRRRMTLQDAEWTLGARAASMQAPYRLGGWRGTGETGWLRVTLVRDQARWRLDTLRLEPAVQEAATR